MEVGEHTLAGERDPAFASASNMAFAVSSLSGPFKIRNSFVLYDSHVPHWLPSQWYLTDDLAEQSLH
jgi:hypothetical protein